MKKPVFLEDKFYAGCTSADPSVEQIKTEIEVQIVRKNVFRIKAVLYNVSHSHHFL